jgi:hypothetical protein
MQYRIESLRVEIVDIRKQLDDIGKAGWDLVCIVHQPKAFKGSAEFSEHIAYFKKPA